MEVSPLDKVLYEELTAKLSLSLIKSGLLGPASLASCLQKQKLLLNWLSLHHSSHFVVCLGVPTNNRYNFFGRQALTSHHCSKLKKKYIYIYIYLYIFTWI